MSYFFSYLWFSQPEILTFASEEIAKIRLKPSNFKIKANEKLYRPLKRRKKRNKTTGELRA